MLVTTECHNDILGKSMTVGKKKREKTSTSHKASRQVAAQDY